MAPTGIGLLGGINTYGYALNNPIGFYDPDEWWVPPSLPQSWVDFSTGMGDVLPFGQGQRLRDLIGVYGGVDPCARANGYGEWVGIVGSFATGVVGGIRPAGARRAGMEFSHWIPALMGGPRTFWNGNFVPTATHALSDPYRYRFVSRVWKAANPMPNVASQQWTRIPNVYKGAAAGGAYGAASAAQAGCECAQ